MKVIDGDKCNGELYPQTAAYKFVELSSLEPNKISATLLINRDTGNVDLIHIVGLSRIRSYLKSKRRKQMKLDKPV